MKKRFMGLTLSIVMLISCFGVNVYGYSRSEACSVGGEISVYGGAAYVLSCSVSGLDGKTLTLKVCDKDGNTLGSVCAADVNGVTELFSAPIIMPKAADAKGRVIVSLAAESDDALDGCTVENIGLHMVSADILAYTQQNGELIIRGNLDNKSGGNIEIYVLRDGEEYETDDSAKRVWSGTESVEPYGSYAAAVDTTEIMSYYTNMTAVVRGLAALGYNFDAVTIDFTYENAGLREKMIKMLAEADSAETVKTIMEGNDGELDNTEILGLSDCAVLDETADREFLYAALYKERAGISADSLETIIIRLCMAEGIKNGTISAERLAELVDAYADALGLTAEGYTPYTTAYKDAAAAEKQAVISAMKGAALDTEERFKSVFANAALRRAMSGAASYTQIVSLLNKNKDYLGLKYIDKLSEKSLEKLAVYARDTNDITTIKNKEKKIYSSKDSGSSSVSTSTGGGKGSGGSGGGGTFSAASYNKNGSTAGNTSSGAADVKDFSDMSDAEWARAYVEKLVKAGIINGYSDGSFRPNSGITRAEFAKMIQTVLKLSSNSAAKSDFADVPPDDWSYPYVSVLCSLGIVNGTDSNTFGRDELITRQDMAVILCRAVQRLGRDMPKTAAEFADSDMISDYARDSVGAAAAAGLISGTDNNRFAPLDNATRAEAAKVVCLLSELLS